MTMKTSNSFSVGFWNYFYIYQNMYNRMPLLQVELEEKTTTFHLMFVK